MNRVIVLALTLFVSMFVQSSIVVDAQEDTSDRMDWWRNAKFGMFIHWGVYSQAGGEWKGETNHAEWLQLTAKIPLAEYTEYAKSFNPVKFDAEQWVQAAKDAGAKYLVITAKHHDGFAMFDSPSNEHNIIKGSAFGRDPLQELAAACENAGIRFCVYYSLGRDWQDPDVPTGGKHGQKLGWRSNLLDFPDEENKDFSKYFERKVKPQVRELLTNYGPIGVMWFDTPEQITPKQSTELLAMIRELQHNCIVNQRVGNKLGDYGTPEQEIPSDSSNEPWETCMTMNGHWGYNKADDKWKSSQTLVHNLIDIVSKGGNYLLNVGPTGEGVIPDPSLDRLAEMGSWLRVNGEAIYGSGPTPFGAELGSYSDTKKDKKGKPKFEKSWEWRATTQPGKLFIHFLKWPRGKFKLPKLEQEITKAYLLADADRKELAIKQNETEVALELPAEMPDRLATVVCLEFDSDQ